MWYDSCVYPSSHHPRVASRRFAHSDAQSERDTASRTVIHAYALTEAPDAHIHIFLFANNVFTSVLVYVCTDAFAKRENSLTEHSAACVTRNSEKKTSYFLGNAESGGQLQINGAVGGYHMSLYSRPVIFSNWSIGGMIFSDKCETLRVKTPL